MANLFPGFLRLFGTLALLNSSPIFAADVPSATLRKDGWTIEADNRRRSITVQHNRLGTLLEDVHLVSGDPQQSKSVISWKSAAVSETQLLLKTDRPESLWTFECSSNELRISSTAAQPALSGKAPVSKFRNVARLLDPQGTPVTWEGTGEVEGGYGGQRTKNPSFLPRQNPECMYFALGQVAGSTFHSLFDQPSDVAIDFPQTTQLRLHGPDSTLEVFMPVSEHTLVRLVPDYFTKVLGVPYYVPFDDSAFPRAPMVWCSWTSYYGDVTEEALVRNTDWLAQNLKPYGFRYVQIDDGYDRGAPGGHHWIEHWDKQKFPRGPEWIAQYIRSQGLHAGLWLVPNAYAGAVDQHPDWYLRDRQGKIVQDYGTPALDSSNPDVLNFLNHLFSTLKGWGFDYYKFDGEHALPKYAPPVDHERLHDRVTDPLIVYRHRLDVIRKVLGPDTFIEGCPAGTPLNGIGYFNSYFNGQDVYNNWHGMYSLFNSINANAFLNHILVYVMPGEGMELGERLTVEEAKQRRPAEVVETARSREEPMAGFGVTTAEARTLVTLVSLSGVVYPLAGVMPELPPERLQLLRRTMPTMPIMPLDLFSRGGDTDWDTFKHVRLDNYAHHYPEILDLKVNSKSGTFDVVALPNWKSGAKTKSISLSAQLGLEPDQPYIAFDFWNEKLLGVFRSNLTLDIESHDTRVVLLHRLLGRPQLIGNSRHITGAYSVENLAWDTRSHKLKGTSDVVAGQDYTLFIHVPSQKSYRARSTASAGGHPLQVRQTQSGELLSISFTSSQSPVSWEVRY